MDNKGIEIIDTLLDKIMDEMGEVFLFTPLYIPRKSIGYIEDGNIFNFTIRKNKNSMKQDYSISELTFENDIEKIKKSIEEAFSINIKKYIA
jgi:hypothetical protein